MLGQLPRPLIAFLVLSIAGALASGCAPSQETTGSDQARGEMRDRKLTLAEYEKTLNPADFDQEVEETEKVHREEVDMQQLEIIRDSTVIEEDVLQGYRIQIFSSASIDEAQAMKSVAGERFLRDTVYVVYDPPVYKVRVGDFINRYDANLKLAEFVDKGFKDAWVVPDRVVRRKIVVVPTQRQH